MEPGRSKRIYTVEEVEEVIDSAVEEVEIMVA